MSVAVILIILGIIFCAILIFTKNIIGVFLNERIKNPRDSYSESIEKALLAQWSSRYILWTFGVVVGILFAGILISLV